MQAQGVLKPGRPRLLIYAHYYPPDAASTGQILQELAQGLAESFQVTVICAVPSYGGTVDAPYRDRKYYVEDTGGVRVIRVRVPDFDKTDKVSRVKHILAYFLRAVRATFLVGKIDRVYAISQPPVLGGLLGVLGKWVKRAAYFYNVQDFNPEQAAAVGYLGNSAVLRWMMRLDKFSLRRADRVILVGRDMVETLKARFAGEALPEYTVINNWVDERALFPLEPSDPRVAAFRAEHALSGKFVFMYSGNLGLYYDLEALMRVIEAFPVGTRAADGREVAFVLIGEGAIRDHLEAYARQNRMDNVTFLAYQRKEALNESLNAADVHLCVSARGIKGVSVPSKLYGQIAVGRPVLGVLEAGAEARVIMEESGCGLVSDPGDYDRVRAHIGWFIDHAGDGALTEMGERGRAYLVKNLTMSRSIEKYAQTIGAGRRRKK